MRSKELSFKTKNGENISAVLDLPIDERPSSYALFAHCFTCSKNLLTVKRISDSLTKNGIAVFRFDFTGSGQSEGDFSETNFSSNLRDLEDAAEYMNQNYEAPKILIGHSLGGAAVLHSAKNIVSSKAGVTIAAPFEPEQVTQMFQEKKDELKAEGQAKVDIGGRDFTIKQQFIEDIGGRNSVKTEKELDKALLIFHSPQDAIVNIDQAAKIYSAAYHPKSFISLDGADHLLRKKQDALYVGEVIASWVKRYLSPEEKSDLTSSQ